MKKELIRIDIMNLSLSQWEKIREIEDLGFIDVTPKELIDLIGFSGGMFFSGKANERELKFIEEFYTLGRSLMNENKYLLITGCSDSLMWYADKIGKEVTFIREESDCYLSRDNGGYINIVKKCDAKIIDNII